MLRTALLAIGNEVLYGYVTNGNGAHLSRKLFESGFSVTQHSVVPDCPKAIFEALDQLLLKNDLVICTGGLGPTCDDHTRKVFADYFGTFLEYRPDIARHLAERYGQNHPSLEDQATLPASAQALLNPVGTASGLIFQKEQKQVIVLPGVPSEMREIFDGQVLPLLQKRSKKEQREFRRSLSFFQKMESQVDPVLRDLHERYPNVEFGIYPNQGTLQVHLIVKANCEEDADQQMHRSLEELRGQFTQHCFEVPSGKIEEAVYQELSQRGETLGTAESCTGGGIARALTQVPGASQYFEGAIVSYSNEVKQSILGVKKETLQNFGAVSEETVSEMLAGVHKALGVDWALAVSGVAGPGGGTKEKPVGTVWIGVSNKEGEQRIRLLSTKGTREQITQRAIHYVLGDLLLWVRERTSIASHFND